MLRSATRLACAAACTLVLCTRGGDGSVATHFTLRGAGGADLPELLSAGWAPRSRRGQAPGSTADDTVALHFAVGGQRFDFPVLERVRGSFAPGASVTTSEGKNVPLTAAMFPTVYQSPNHDASVTIIGECPCPCQHP